MSAIEGGQSRLASSFDEVRLVLDDTPAAAVILRSLSNPARTRLVSDPRAFDAADWLADSAGEPKPPAVAMLDQGSAHWLVTDGASEALVGWAMRAPLERVFRKGSATENVAITQLGMRRSLGSMDTVDILVAVSNLGTREAARELSVSVGSNHVETVGLAVPGGQTVYRTTAHAVGDVTLTARLNPGDPVSADDVLSASMSTLSRVPVIVDGACPASLSRAIELHPALRLTRDDQPAELQIICSDRVAAAQAIVRFHVTPAEPLQAPAEWLPGVGRLQEIHLASDWLAAGSWNGHLGSNYQTLLSAAGQPLLIRRKNQTVTVESVLDMTHPRFAGQPEYAAIIAGLIDLALDRPALDPVAVSSGDPEASIIRTTELPLTGPRRSAHGKVRLSLADMLLALAAFLAVVEILLVWRAILGLRRA